MKKYLLILLVLVLPQFASATTIYLTSGSTWTVPPDWNSSNNTIEAIGNGSDAGGDERGGGGGGAYSKSVNVTLTPNSTVAYSVAHIPLTWPGDSTAGHTVGQNSGDSYFCNSTSNCTSLHDTAVVVGAAGGKGSVNSPYGPYPIDAIGGRGGSDGDGIATGPGALRYSGGNGGNCANDLDCAPDSAPGSGGGAAGPYGSGAAGGNAAGAGGSADAGYGGGGGGLDAAGSNGQEFGSSYGSGGGGGGAEPGAPGGAGGNYGGGGGSGGDDRGGLYPAADASGAGGGGLIVITYTPVPTCTITLSPTTIPYGSSSTLTWSTTNAGGLYIDQLGYVNVTGGSTTVAPSTNTDYTGTVTGSGQVAYCTASGTSPAGTLTVTPPSAPTTTITASSTSIYVGQSTGIKATFAAASNDTLIHDNIDSPVGTGLGATTNPDAAKYYTFTPSSTGTYTFYARAQTSYYPSWTTYAQTSVTVLPAPSCTVSFSQNPVSQGQFSTLSWSSSNANSFSINNIGSLTPNTTGSTQVSPSHSTDYTGTVSSGGVTNYCTASGSSPAGTLSVSCTQSWSCGGTGGQTIVQTNTDCSTTNLATCVSPQYCSTGVSSCSFPAISFNPSGNETGHLQLLPNIAHSNNTVLVAWNISNAQSCTVTGTNSDSWTGISGSHTSKPITSATIYSLACTAYGSNPSVNETQTVILTPIYQEQ